MEPTNPDPAFDADAEAVTERSFTAIVPSGSVPTGAPEQYPSFLHRVPAFQAVGAAAFAAIVLCSVGLILAWPAGGGDVARRKVERDSNLMSTPLPSLPRMVAEVRSVTAAGGVDQVVLEKHVVSATAQFSACYDRAAGSGQVSAGQGDLAVVVNLDHLGSVVSASSHGPGLPGLNACVARLAERLGTLLRSTSGPSRLEWTVSYRVSIGSVERVDTEVR